MAAKLKLDPGIYKNGTPYSAAGRWADCNLVRWHEGVIKAIAGWRARVDTTTGNPVELPMVPDEFVRSGVVVADSANGTITFLGTNHSIYMISPTNVISNVTPTSFVPKPANALSSSGYGMYRYGYGQYGTPRPTGPARVPNVFSWGFDNYGFWPIAVAREDVALRVFIKQPSNADFVAIAGSPLGAHDVVVTDERFVMTFGKAGDYRSVTWSDREDYDQWTPAINNEAGDITLAGSGKLVRGIKVNNQILILGEEDAFSARYVGPPYVYGFNRVGDQCGLIGPEAVAVAKDFAMWLGPSSFFRFDGTVKEVPCDVIDYYTETKNDRQRSKTVAVTRTAYSEIWWHYQSRDSDTGENDLYIAYNYAINRWYHGKLHRTCAFDADPLLYPLMVAPSGALYDHEVPSSGRFNNRAYIKTGPIELESGSELMGIAYLFPDARTSKDLQVKIEVRNDSEADPIATYTYSELIMPLPTTGVMGRDLRIIIEESEEPTRPDWVIGDFRVEPVVMKGPKR